jgi:hypothetical protein
MIPGAPVSRKREKGRARRFAWEICKNRIVLAL